MLTPNPFANQYTCGDNLTPGPDLITLSGQIIISSHHKNPSALNLSSLYAEVFDAQRLSQVQFNFLAHDSLSGLLTILNK